MRVTLATGPKGSNEVLKDAFTLLGCEPWGGPSVTGWSKKSDFLRCPYRYYLKHVRKVHATLVADSSANQDVGSFVHTLLATYYAAQLPAPIAGDDGQQIVYPGYHDPCPTPEQMLNALHAAGAEPSALHLADQLFQGYIEHWGEDVLQPMAVEMSVGRVDLHTSRYDLVANVADGIHDGLWIVEHKTASPRTDFELWQLDGEILGEMASWELSELVDVFGERLRGVCVNALVKSPNPSYRRLWLPVQQPLVDDFITHQVQLSKSVQHYQQIGIWPKSHYGCMARYDRCLFFDHCCTLSDAFLVPNEGANK